MSFDATPRDSSTPAIPMSSAVPDGSTAPYAIAGGPAYSDSGNTKVPVSMYIKDGNNVTLGSQADPASIDYTQTAKSHMSFLKGMVQILADVWDSINHRLHVNVDNANVNGQATMVNSSPVVIALDQVVPIKRSASNTVYVSTQTAQGTGNSGDIAVGQYTELWLDVNITATPSGTNPTIQFELDRKGADGLYYPLWFGDLINGLPANPTKISASFGAGMQWNESFGSTIKIFWTVGGTATPEYTFTVNVGGK